MKFEEIQLLSSNEIKSHQSEIFFEQYRIYVESAEETSKRRISTNQLFLTLTSGALAGLSFLVSQNLGLWAGVLGLITSTVGFGLCMAWKDIIYSYRIINRAKFEVIGKFEESLPASPFWKAEWSLLGSNDPRFNYRSLAKIESKIPKVMAFGFFIFFLISCLILVRPGLLQ